MFQKARLRTSAMGEKLADDLKNSVHRRGISKRVQVSRRWISSALNNHEQSNNCVLQEPSQLALLNSSQKEPR